MLPGAWMTLTMSSSLYPILSSHNRTRERFVRLDPPKYPSTILFSSPKGWDNFPSGASPGLQCNEQLWEQPRGSTLPWDLGLEPAPRRWKMDWKHLIKDPRANAIACWLLTWRDCFWAWVLGCCSRTGGRGGRASGQEAGGRHCRRKAAFPSGVCLQARGVGGLPGMG